MWTVLLHGNVDCLLQGGNVGYSGGNIALHLAELKEREGGGGYHKKFTIYFDLTQLNPTAAGRQDN